jgi:hypothetical protein
LETPTAWFPFDFFNEYHEIMGKKTQRIDGEIMRKHKTTMIFGMRSWGVAPSKIMLVIPWCAYYPLVTASHFLPGHLEKRKPPASQALSFDCWYSTAIYIATRMPHRRSAQRLGQGTTSVSNTTMLVYGRVYVDK